jgi:G3E family GTPase
MSQSRIPVSILTGFLGAGKSSLLNRILKDPGTSDTAVIINEFGEVGIDNFLVEASGDTLMELSNGCLCCTVRGELIDTLAEMMDGMQTGRTKPIRRVVIETTGLADPAPVMQSVMGNPVIAQNFELDGVITVVDAVNGMSTLARHIEAVKQVAVADRLVISKQSMATPDELAALKARLKELNPRAPLIDGDSDMAGTAQILVNGLYDPASKIADVARWLRDESAAEDHDHAHHHDDHNHDHDHAHNHHDGHHHDHSYHGHHHHDVNRHGDSIRSFSIVHDKPIDPMALSMFVDLLRSAHGEKLLRMKAIVALSDDPERPVVLHGVQSIFHPPQRLQRWPDGGTRPDGTGVDRRTRMVLITQDLPEAFVADLFAAFTGEPRIDRPDRAALEDNPLAVPGLKM